MRIPSARGLALVGLCALPIVLAAGGRAGAVQISEGTNNNTPGTAPFVNQGNSVFGEINPVADVDFFRRTLVAAGDLVFALVSTSQSAFSKDSILTVLNNDTTTLTSDDDDGQDASSVVAGVATTQAGSVYYSIVENGNDATIIGTPGYELFQSIVPATATSPESEPNDSSAAANPIVAQVTTGSAASGESDWYSVTVPAGGSFRRLVVIVDLDPDKNSVVTPLSTTLLNGALTPLANALSDPGANAMALEPVNVGSAAGTYFLRIDGQPAGAATNYRFTVLFEEFGLPVELQSVTVD